MIEHYRYLQGNKLENAVSVMEFENGNDLPLGVGEEITVFNMSRDDSRACKTVDAGVLVSIHGREEMLYSARVVQTGETPAAQAQSFAARRYADRYKADLPVLLGSTPVTKNMYRKGTYFAMIKIVEKLGPEFHLLEIPTRSAWVNMPRTDISRFAHAEMVVHATRKIIKRGVKGLTFKVPAFEAFNPSVNLEDLKAYETVGMDFKEVDLEEKRQIKRPSLIRKKLLVRR